MTTDRISYPWRIRDAADLPPTVVLRPGWVVPLEALDFVWSLEAKGCSFTLDGFGAFVTPWSRLTDDERYRFYQHCSQLQGIHDMVAIVALFSPQIGRVEHAAAEHERTAISRSDTP